MKHTLLMALLGMSLSGNVFAQVSVEEPWVRATVPGQPATGAFMRLTAMHDASLVGAASPVAGKVEIHEMQLVDDVMKMRPIAALPLPAAETVELKPGGYHIMLMELKQQMQVDEQVPLTLTLVYPDGRQEVQELSVPVRPLHAARGAEHAPPAGAAPGHAVAAPAAHPSHGGQNPHSMH